MINYQVFGLVGWMTLFEQERRIADSKVRVAAKMMVDTSYNVTHTPKDRYLVTEDDRQRVAGMLAYADQLCRQLNLIRMEDRIVHFRRALRQQPENPVTLQHQLQAMHDALHDDMPLKYFYFYPEEKVKRLLLIGGEWEAAFNKFQSIEPDATAAVDCYALGHNDASVFHCMRVLECGLSVLAKNVGLTFDVQQWKNIIDDIEHEIEVIRDRGIPGLAKAEKDARLGFLSEAAKEFFYFKDGWRNYVSHSKGRYDENQAKGVLEHVRAFMNHLASQLSE